LRRGQHCTPLFERLIRTIDFGAQPRRRGTKAASQPGGGGKKDNFWQATDDHGSGFEEESQDVHVWREVVEGASVPRASRHNIAVGDGHPLCVCQGERFTLLSEDFFFMLAKSCESNQNLSQTSVAQGRADVRRTTRTRNKRMFHVSRSLTVGSVPENNMPNGRKVHA